MTEQVVDRGFMVVETRRDEGVLTAEKFRSFEVTDTVSRTTDPTGAVPTYDVRATEIHLWDVIAVLLFERLDGSTSIQFTAGSKLADRSFLGAPSEDLREVAVQVAEFCR